MYLKKLEIIGFKSFGHRVNLEFPRSITCVVGPNGVGKSNLVEAIRWAIGEQSLKVLRSKKNEDIIFSSRRNRLNFAESFLYLENENEKEGLPRQLVIGRRVLRNGENEYLINKNKVKLQDFLVTGAQANLGPKSYSVIGQGMIDSILYLSPSERKDFFAEATGIKKYQIKKRAAVLKLKKTQENLSQVKVALQEIEPRMRFLSRQIKKLAKRKDLEESLNEAQQKYYGSKKFRLEKEEKALKQEIKKIKEEIDKRSEELKSFQEKFKKIYETGGSTTFFKLQNDYDNLLKERRKILENIADLGAGQKERKKISKDKLIEIEETIRRIVDRQESLRAELERVKKIEDLRIISDGFNKTTEELKRLLEIFKEKENSSTQETNKLDQELKMVNQKIKDLETALKNVLREEENKRKEIVSEQEKIQKKQEEISQINFSLKEKEIELAKLETKKEDLEAEIKRDSLGLKISEILEAQPLKPEEEDELFLKIKKIKSNLEMIEAIDPNISKEYQECSERYNFLSSQSNDLEEAFASLKKIKEELDEKMKSEFITNFNKINQEFERYFKILFKGGSAGLFLEEKEEEWSEFEEAEDKWLIEIKARPPGKKIKTLETLSGGEKALTSLALVFAIIKTKNPPFVVLDEVDAALDELNSLRFTEIVKDLAKKIQFIIITHNHITMEMADALYGLTMKQDGISYLLSLKLERV